jgi:hypothetical protein
MNKHLKKFILIGIFGIACLIILPPYILWFYAPQVASYQSLSAPPSGDNTSLLIDDLADLVDDHFPIPFYFHVLRSHIQSSESARLVSLSKLRYSGVKRNSFCSHEDFTEISKLRSFYQTKQDYCIYFADGYIAISFIAWSSKTHLDIEELYKKSKDGRIELVLQAKVSRVNDP